MKIFKTGKVKSKQKKVKMKKCYSKTLKSLIRKVK